jgi:hypothetical protein
MNLTHLLVKVIRNSLEPVRIQRIMYLSLRPISIRHPNPFRSQKSGKRARFGALSPVPVWNAELVCGGEVAFALVGGRI